MIVLRNSGSSKSSLTEGVGWGLSLWWFSPSKMVDIGVICPMKLHKVSLFLIQKIFSFLCKISVVSLKRYCSFWDVLNGWIYLIWFLISHKASKNSGIRDSSSLISSTFLYRCCGVLLLQLLCALSFFVLSYLWQTPSRLEMLFSKLMKSCS